MICIISNISKIFKKVYNANITYSKTNHYSLLAPILSPYSVFMECLKNTY